MIALVLPLLRAFIGICTFQLTPQDLPRSNALLAAAVLSNLTLSLVIYFLESPFGYALLKAILETAVLFALTYLLLFLMSYSRRLLQTMTALMGSGAVLSGVAFVTMVLTPTLPGDVGVALLRGISVLNLLVIAHVLRHALGTWFLVGLLIAFGYALLFSKLFLFADALLSVAAA